MSGFSPQERSAVLSLTALYATRMLGLFMVLPVMSLYARNLEGSTPFLVGLAIGAYGLSQSVFQIPFGILSDRFGRRPMILAGLAVFLLGSAVAAVSTSITGIIIGRFLQGVGAISGVVMALVADLTSEENRSRAMAMIGASIGLCFALAMVFGPVLGDAAGLPGIFWFTAALAFAGILVTLFLLPQPALGAQASTGHIPVPALLRRTALHPDLWRFNIGVFLLHGILMAAFLVIPLNLQDEFGYSTQQHGIIYLALFGASFIAMLPLMLMAEQRGWTKPLFLLAVLLLGIGLAVLPWLRHTRTGFFTGLFLFFMAFNLLEAQLPSLLSKTCPPGARGTAMGIYATFQFCGTFYGGSLGGWWLGRQGEDSLLYVCASLVLCWLVLASGMRVPTSRNTR